MSYNINSNKLYDVIQNDYSRPEPSHDLQYDDALGKQR